MLTIFKRKLFLVIKAITTWNSSMNKEDKKTCSHMNKEDKKTYALISLGIWHALMSYAQW